MSALERADAQALDDHDRLELVEARLDLVDERMASDSRPRLDPVAERQRDTIVALTVMWLSLVVSFTVLGYALVEGVTS